MKMYFLNMERTAQNKIEYPLLITGATGSMGSVAVKEMARRGYPVIMTYRKAEKAEALKRELLAELPDASLETMYLNLDNRSSIESFLQELGTRKLSGIFINAGVIYRNFSVTDDGYEHTMAVNFINQAILVLKLLDNLTPGAHIVNMVSLAAGYGSLDESWYDPFNKKYKRLVQYSDSKLALLLFSVELARRHPEFHVNVSDPWIVDSDMITMGKWFDPLTDIFFRPFINSPEKGVAPALAALQSGDTMKYFVGKKVKPIPSKFTSDKKCKILYEYIDNLVMQK